ncbi:uracil-DNA glycosylase [Shewanella fodinae]|uniref:Uracil-DNA glycosylase n=1 Tax=Shewanella fodinae TaxID=552357 RepID=A0A4R2FK07_9GAMM|nr:uracil-DNA glycosylase [Shewanella fodinae]TCN90230.1 uracil-DNA glycosylase [Shewanella fodinae]
MTQIPTWADVLGPEKTQEYFVRTLNFIDAERAQNKHIYPPKADTFNALRYTPLAHVKVVILGQDPYHGPGQAHGLCFSVKDGVAPPPSLQNIFQELCHTIPGFSYPTHGELSAWARQGVLLLNTVLSVEEGKAHSHAHLGWEQFTDKVVEAVDNYQQGVAFLLWGRHAGEKAQRVNTRKHLVLKAAHPSPLSASKGFFGCNHFNLANQYLQSQGKTPINWQI